MKALLGLSLFAIMTVHAHEFPDPSDALLNEDPRMNAVFEIADGTGSGHWNTAQTPIEVCNVKGKATITYKNLDGVDHQVHTSGVPHQHSPAKIKSGDSQTLVINTAAFDNTTEGSPNNMYDHNYGPKTSRIYFRLVSCDDGLGY